MNHTSGSWKKTTEMSDAARWKVVGSHVLPIHDLFEHSLKNCWCKPYDDDGITVHNSADLRELYELEKTLDALKTFLDSAFPT